MHAHPEPHDPGPVTAPPGMPAGVGALLLGALHRSGDVVGVTDDAGRVVWLNAAGRARLGVADDRPLHTTDLFGDDAFERYYREVRPALMGGESWTGVLPVRDAGGHDAPYSVTVVGELGAGGEVVALTAVGRPLSVAVDPARAVGEDGLTGLPNRALLHDRLDVALRRAGRAGGLVAVVFADVDGLKAVNDLLGHAAGDTLLRTVAERLSTTVRPSDTVARLGGDEFVVVCDPVTGPDDAMSLADRLRTAVSAAPMEHEGAPVVVSASFGVALGAGPDDSAADLLRRADAAMYRAKTRGSRLELAAGEGDGDGAARRHDEVVHELSVALSRRQVGASLAPVVRLADGVVTGWRASPHWERDGVVVPLGAVLPHVERSAVALALDLCVIRAAMRSVPTTADGAAGRDGPGVLVAVTARTLSDPFLPGLVAEVLESVAPGAPPLTLLLPGASVSSRSLVGADALAALRRVGVHLATHVLRPTGVPLRDLADSGVAMLVIEPETTREVAADPAAGRAVAAVVGLAAGLGAAVLADGVDDHVQEAAVAALGVTHVCGRRYGPSNTAP